MPSTLSSQFRQKCAIYLRNRAPTKSSQPSREIAVNTSDLPRARQQLAEIAKRILCVETLETRHPDRLDFHDTAVWSIRAAPEAAYLAGVASAKTGAAWIRARPLAIRVVSNTTGAETQTVRAFSQQLSRSPYASHLTDEVSNCLPCRVALSDAVATVMQKQTASKIGIRISRQYGLPHDLP
jgi:hypothetical protein